MSNKKKNYKKVQHKVQNKKKSINKGAQPVKKQWEISSWIQKNSLAVFSALFLFSIFVIYRNYWTLEHLFIFKDIGSDTYNTFLSTYIQRARLLHHHEGIYYSLYSGMGRATDNSIFMFIRAPFQSLFFLLPPEKTGFGIFFILMFELIISAFLFYQYLNLVLSDKKVVIVGALFLSFSAVITLGGTWYLQFYNILTFIFLLWAFEKWNTQKKYIWFPFALFFVFETKGIVFVAIYLLFIFFYSLFRYFEEKDFVLKDFIKHYTRLGALTILGLAMNAYFGYHSISTLLEQPRVTGEYSQLNKNASQSIFHLGSKQMYITEVMRTMGNNLMGSGKVFRQTQQNGQRYLVPDFKGWQYNYFEAPWMYLGLLSLILFTQIFTIGNKRQKISRAVFLALWMLPLIFPYFRKAFWGFAGDYYRFESLYYVFPMFYFSMRFLSTPNAKLNVKLLIATTLFWLLFLVFPYNRQLKASLETNALFITGFILIAEAFSLYFLYKKNFREWAFIAIILLVLTEIYYNSSAAVNDRMVVSKAEYKAKLGYNDFTVDALKWLKIQDSAKFYRINKDYQSGIAVHGSMNDAQAQGYFGTKSYKSFQQPNYLRALEKFNVIKPHDETAGRWAIGFSTRPILQIMAHTKYNLSKSSQPDFLRFGYQQINQLGDVKILKNKYFFPLGYTYNSFITEKEHQKLNQVQKDFTALRTCIVDSSELLNLNRLMHFDLKDTLASYNWNNIQAFTDSATKEHLQITYFKHDDIRGNIELTTLKVIFFAIPFDESWQLFDRGKSVKIFRANYGFVGALLPAGKHELQLKFYSKTLNTNLLYVSLFFWLVWGALLALAIIKKRKKNIL